MMRGVLYAEHVPLFLCESKWLLRLKENCLSSSVCLPFPRIALKGLLCGAWWLFGRFVAFRPKDLWLESHSGRHIRTFGKSFTRSCLRSEERRVGKECRSR